jgi:hypothetical protein
MGRKEFGRDDRGYVFMSDERDIATPWSKRHEVHAWAEQNKIAIEYQGTLGGLDVWRVRDDQQRAWFNLRWS